MIKSCSRYHEYFLQPLITMLPDPQLKMALIKEIILIHLSLRVRLYI